MLMSTSGELIRPPLEWVRTMTRNQKQRGLPLWAALGMVGFSVLSAIITIRAAQGGDTVGVVSEGIIFIGSLVYIAGYVVTRFEGSTR